MNSMKSVHFRIQRHLDMTSNHSTGPGSIYLQLNTEKSKVGADVKFLV